MCLSLFIIFASGDNYISGRDTIKSFGSGRYQIIGTNHYDNDIKVLIDLKDEKTIESYIYNYYERETSNNVYIIGENGYSVLNYKKEEYKQSKNLNEFNKKDQEIFEIMSY